MMTTHSKPQVCTNGVHPACSDSTVLGCMREEAMKRGMVLLGPAVCCMSGGACMVSCGAGAMADGPCACTVVAAVCLDASGACMACVCCMVDGARMA